MYTQQLNTGIWSGLLVDDAYTLARLPETPQRNYSGIHLETDHDDKAAEGSQQGRSVGDDLNTRAVA